eukprot:1448326-Pyramimonas_sp.AAC.1
MHQPLDRHDGGEPCDERRLHVARALRRDVLALGGWLQPRDLGHPGGAPGAPVAAGGFRLLLPEGRRDPGPRLQPGPERRAGHCLSTRARTFG